MSIPTTIDGASVAIPPGGDQRRRGRGPEIDVLLVGHDPTSSAEATLVLAVYAASAGLKLNGEPMAKASPRTPTARVVANELGFSRDAVRRGVRELIERGELVEGAAGLEVAPGVLAKRAADARRVVRLPAALRSLSLRPRWLLLAGLVFGQVDKRGQFRASLNVLADRLGWAHRTARSALDAVRERGVVVSHRVPNAWYLVHRRGVLSNRHNSPSPNRHNSGAESTAEPASAAESSQGVVKPSEVCSETVTRRSSDRQNISDARTTDVSPGRACAREQTSPPARGDSGAEPDPEQKQNLTRGWVETRAVVGEWAARMIRAGQERLAGDDARHLATLLDEIEPPEEDPSVRDARAVRRERLSLARRVVRWEPSVERLARWLAVAVRRYRVRNPGAYLRRAAERGDTGTLLARHGNGEHVLEREHEVAMHGPFAREVDGLTAAMAAVLGAHGDTRGRLAADLRDAIAAGKLAVAREAVLALLDGQSAHPRRVARIAMQAGVQPERVEEALAA